MHDHILVHGGDIVLAGDGHDGRGSGGSGGRWAGGFKDCKIELTKIEIYFVYVNLFFMITVT